MKLFSKISVFQRSADGLLLLGVVRSDLNKKSRQSPRFSSMRGSYRSVRFYERADALGTQDLADLAPVFIDANGLQVWTKSPGSGLLRPGTVATKSRLFSTMSTCSHNCTSFARYPYLKPGWQNIAPGNQPSKFTTKNNQEQAKTSLFSKRYPLVEVEYERR